MKALAILFTLALSATSLFGQTPSGDPVAITNITINAGTADLQWEAPAGKAVTDLTLWEATTLTGQWNEVTSGIVSPKTLGGISVDASAPSKFWRLYAASVCNGCSVSYTQGAEVSWFRANHTVMVCLRDNCFKVTRYPADHDVKADPASRTDHLYLRYIVPNGASFSLGIASNDMGQPGGTTVSVTMNNSYYIGVYTVTEAQWQRVMGAGNASSTLPVAGIVEGVAINYTTLRGDASPTFVIPEDKNGGFMARLNYLIRTNNPELDTPSNRISFDFPTEAQWEYACRAGIAGSFSDGLGNYPWPMGPTWRTALNKICWDSGHPDINNGSLGVPSPSDSDRRKFVGQLDPNNAGLYDMHGNMWEWCLDRWMPTYPGGTGDDPKTGGSSAHRAMRGGSWHNTAFAARSGYRGDFSPDDVHASFGFRLRASGAVVPAP